MNAFVRHVKTLYDSYAIDSIGVNIFKMIIIIITVNIYRRLVQLKNKTIFEKNIYGMCP